MPNFRILSLTVITAAISACGGMDDGDTSQAVEVGTGSNTQKIAGVYAWEGALIGDEGYVTIDNEGKLSVYDYAGDSVDNHANCYWVTEEAAILDRAYNDEYIMSRDNQDPELVEIIRTSEGIVLNGSNDTRGDFSDTYYGSGMSISDFTPECDTAEQPTSSKGLF